MDEGRTSGNLTSLADAASQFHVAVTADQLQNGSSARKGSRIGKACLTCRLRKHRCSGGLPCYNCNATGNECVYPEGRKVWTRSSRSVAWLEERVKNLEK